MSLQYFFPDLLLTVCPETEREVMARLITLEPQASDSAETIVWWWCTACRSWHTSIIQFETGARRGAPVFH
jgi:hypothetical protein